MTDPERFRPGDRIRVREQCPSGNPRTPGYLRGRVGTVTERHGVIVNPLDHHQPYPPLYSISFDIERSESHDLVIADLHDEWLEPA